MARKLAKYLAVCCVLVLLDACGRSWFEERPAWRHDAEVACLKSGAVKQGPGIAELRPIQGPGMCGADFPLRVTMLGEGGPLGFADDLFVRFAESWQFEFVQNVRHYIGAEGL